ncbi:MAG: iron-containing alcohol dehydrogenase [Defluviitaleaceae bacterium]|nr:iron-containing alcohol dehydrogenase [Defluviitaleaceae bacterium]
MEKFLCPCGCGNFHNKNATRLIAGEGATERFCAILEGSGLNDALAVCDANTLFAAEAVRDASRGIINKIFVFEENPLAPDERAVGSLFIAAEGDCGALVAVGSGTVNDITRYVSHRLGLPYCVYATAASMDGYASSVAPLTVDGLKRTYPARAPLCAAGDPDVVNRAPARLSSAGYGDMAGKNTSLIDFELEGFIEGSGYCRYLEREMQSAMKGCKNKPRPDEILGALFNSGVVMQMAGNSKPASGSEHHLAHYFEMAAHSGNDAVSCGQKILHGEYVGVAALIMIRLAAWLAEDASDEARAVSDAGAFDKDAWLGDMRKIYKKASDGVAALWEREDAESLSQDAALIVERRSQIKEIIRRRLPNLEEVEDGLRRNGCPAAPGELGISKEDFNGAILHAFRIRPRRTMLWTANVLGLLPEYAARLAEIYY